MVEINAVVNQKGGTGKTTTAINLGSALTKLGRKVALIDLDPQANLSYSLGITNTRYNMADVFMGSQTLRAILINKKDMFIAPGAVELADIEASIVDLPGRENILKGNLSELNDFDHVLIDSPPSLSLLTVNALNAADALLIPLQMEVLSLQGLIQLLSTIEDFRNAFNKPFIVRGIIAIKYDRRRKLSEEILAQLKSNIGEKVFKTVIRENVRLAEAPSFAQSVINYAPTSTGAQDYISLAKEFIKTKL